MITRSLSAAIPHLAGVVALVLVSVLPSDARAPGTLVNALAPAETVLDGRQELVGVAVAADGALYVSDRGAGVVYRIAPSGALTIAVAGLDRPAGLALDTAGRLLIAEEKAGRILRLESSGALTVLATGIKRPRWLAVAPDDALYVSAHRLTAPDGADEDEGRKILRLVPGVSLTVVASGIRRLEGLARLNGALVAGTKGLESEAESPGKLLQYPILADGSLGLPLALLGVGLKQPVGLALDQLGALYVASKEVEIQRDKFRRAVGKVHPDAHLSTFAEHLGDPQGVALGSDGSLYLADGKAGRLLRFRASPPPTLEALPEFTNRSPITAGGTTEPSARVDIFINESPTAVTGSADAAGAFSVSVPLTLNAQNTLHVFATPHAGDGLTSAPAEATLAHDDVAPGVTFLHPPAGAFVRQTVSLQAQATDSMSGVASLAFALDGSTLATLPNPDPTRSFLAITPFDTTFVPDGSHTLGATALDHAGNSASTSRFVITDNTPPDTQLTGGPAGEIGDTTATFTFTGTDNLTPPASLLFAWSLDGAPFTAFSAGTTVMLTGLAEGLHTFTVKARDLAGNEDPTPASRSFTVRLGPTITTVDPPSGPVGAFVTISGARFEPGATRVTFNSLAAVLRSVTATTLTTTVPPGATTGLLTVSTPRGTASRPYTVTTTQDFTLAVDPATVSVVQGTSVSVLVRTFSTGSYTGLVSLTTGPPPSGVTASFSPSTLAANGTGVLTLATTGSAPPGLSAIDVRGTAKIESTTVTRTGTITLEVQAPGQTVLIGQVRDESDFPLAGVSLKLGGPQLTLLGTTDAGGNFLVPLPVTGTQVFLIDGSTANTATLFYPTIPVTLTIQPGVANPLGFLPRLRGQPASKLVSITPTRDTILADPDLPGFEMTIPAGVSVIGWDGQPNMRVSVTAVPIDRSPLPPVPPGQTARQLYLFSFGKMGGGTPTGTIPVDTPNDVDGLPGDRVDLYYFNEAPDGTAPNQWEKYGTGTVSPDGSRILTDINPATGAPYGIPRFCCGGRLNVLPPSPRPGGGPSGGPGDGGHFVSEPVDAATGFFYLEKTDLVLPGILPVAITRTYRTQLTNAGPFGMGTSWPYDVFLQPPPNGSPEALVLFTPGNRLDLFARQSDGTFVNTTSPALRGVVVTASGGVRALRFKDGRLWRFDLTGRLVSQSDRKGNTVTLTRDSQGRVTTITEPGGRRLTITYTGTALRIDRIQDPLGREVRYGYDAQGRLESVTDPAGGVTRYTYDAAHRMLTITDSRGITFLTNEYDAQGRVSRQIQADGGTWIFAYTSTGSFVSETTVINPLGQVTTYRFNAAGYVVSQTDALGQTTSFERQPGTNLLLATIDPLGRTTRFEYDQAGNVMRIADPTGNVRTFSYEPVFNRVTSITDPLGNVMRFEYGAQGNLTAIVDPLGARTALAYNAFGQPVSTTDPLGNTIRFEYDAVGNLTAITDPLGQVTRREYDAGGRLIGQLDPRGRLTAFGYDALNHLTRLTDPLGGVTPFSYDGNGNLLTVTDARGSTVTHTYDTMDRLAARTAPLGGVEQFEYDGLGNLIRFVDRKGQGTTFSYDGLNRRVGASYADGSVMSAVYDAAGRLIQASDSMGDTILNQYDALDRLLAQTTGLGSVSYQYDALGRRARMDAPGQVPVFYTYDTASRLTQVVQGSQVVAFQHDALGRRTRLTLPNGVSTEYQYDSASRLTALIYRNALAVLGDLTYQYDAGGNRIRVGGSLARTLLPDPVDSATYDAANRQLSFGDKQMTYDPNGNLTSITDPSGATTFTWDARNRLVRLDGPGVTASFTYDAIGRRIAKETNGQPVQYLYDGLDILQELTGESSTAYLRGLAIDEALVRNGVEFYLGDALGSILGLTDPTGILITRYIYDPFGQTAVEGTASPNPFQFTAREHDGPTGLYFHRARYYAPPLHRFLSEDRLGLLGRDINLYRYVWNNPVALVDPMGEWGIPGFIVGGVSGFVGGVLAARAAQQGTVGGLAAAIAGSLVGAAVGAFNPFASYSVGTAIGAATASSVGQATTNVLLGQLPFANFSIGAVVGTGVATGLATGASAVVGGVLRAGIGLPIESQGVVTGVLVTNAAQATALVVRGIFEGIVSGLSELGGDFVENFIRGLASDSVARRK